MSKADEQRANAIAELRKQTNVRPETIANALGISGKNVRGFLRATFTRPIEAKGTTWVLSNDQTVATIDHFVKRQAPEQAPAK